MQCCCALAAHAFATSECATTSAIELSLQQVYHETHYMVFGPRPFTLRIGAVSPELLAEHRAHELPGSAFVTACNPFSRSLSDEENRARQTTLLADLQRRGLRCIEGHGQHPSNDWPPEPSFLVLGLDRAAACDLGRRWEQNAIVFAGPDAIPELILLR